MSNPVSYNRIADNLYQNPASGTYFAVVRHNSKLVKSSLKTTDKAEAKRKLRTFIVDLERVDGAGAKKTVGCLVDQ